MLFLTYPSRNEVCSILSILCQLMSAFYCCEEKEKRGKYSLGSNLYIAHLNQAVWYTAATTTPLQDGHIIILIKVDEKEKLNFFKGLVFAPPLDTGEPKSDTHGEKHR